MTDQEKIADLRIVLRLVLDQVDYTVGNCNQTDMVGAVLPKMIIATAKTVLKNTL